MFERAGAGRAGRAWEAHVSAALTMRGLLTSDQGGLAGVVVQPAMPDRKRWSWKLKASHIPRHARLSSQPHPASVRSRGPDLGYRPPLTGSLQSPSAMLLESRIR